MAPGFLKKLLLGVSLLLWAWVGSAQDVTKVQVARYGGNAYYAIPAGVKSHQNTPTTLFISVFKDSVRLCDTTFMGTPARSYEQIHAIAVVKADSAGNRLWSQLIRGTGPITSVPPAIDDEGNLYLAGQSNSYRFIVPNDSTFQRQSGLDAFALKISPQGHVDWIKNYGEAGRITVKGLKLLPSGEPLLLTQVDQNPRIHNTSLCDSNVNWQSGLLIKLDQHGEIRWLKTLGDLTEDVQVVDFDVDPAGRTWSLFVLSAAKKPPVVAQNGITVWQLGTTVTSTNSDSRNYPDYRIAVVDEDGQLEARHQLGKSDLQLKTLTSVGNHVYLGGRARPGCSIQGMRPEPSGHVGGMVACLNADGRPRWVRIVNEGSGADVGQLFAVSDQYLLATTYNYQKDVTFGERTYRKNQRYETQLYLSLINAKDGQLKGVQQLRGPNIGTLYADRNQCWFTAYSRTNAKVADRRFFCNQTQSLGVFLQLNPKRSFFSDTKSTKPPTIPLDRYPESELKDNRWSSSRIDSSRWMTRDINEYLNAGKVRVSDQPKVAAYQGQLHVISKEDYVWKHSILSLNGDSLGQYDLLAALEEGYRKNILLQDKLDLRSPVLYQYAGKLHLVGWTSYDQNRRFRLVMAQYDQAEGWQVQNTGQHDFQPTAAYGRPIHLHVQSDPMQSGIQVAWRSTVSEISILKHNGKVWLKEQIEVGEPLYDIAFAIDQEGSQHLAYTNQHGRLKYGRIKKNTWDFTPLAESGAKDLSMAITNKGLVNIFYYYAPSGASNRDLRKISGSDGEWKTQLFAQSVREAPAVCQDDEGNLILLTHGPHSGPYFFHSSDEGRSFLRCFPPVRPKRYGAAGSADATIANGRVYMVWSNDNQLSLASRTLADLSEPTVSVNKKWGRAEAQPIQVRTLIKAPAGEYQTCQLEITDRGWHQIAVYDGDLYYGHSADQGANWEMMWLGPQEGQRHAWLQSDQVDWCIDSEGFPIIAFRSLVKVGEEQRFLLSVVQRKGVSWQRDTLALGRNRVGFTGPIAVAQSSKGKLAVSIADQKGVEVFTQTEGGWDRFTMQQQFTVRPESAIEARYDRFGRLHLVWTGAHNDLRYNGNLNYALLDEDEVGLEYGTIPWSSSLFDFQVDEDGVPHVVSRAPFGGHVAHSFRTGVREWRTRVVASVPQARSNSGPEMAGRPCFRIGKDGQYEVLLPNLHSAGTMHLFTTTNRGQNWQQERLDLHVLDSPRVNWQCHLLFSSQGFLYRNYDGGWEVVY